MQIGKTKAPHVTFLTFLTFLTVNSFFVSSQYPSNPRGANRDQRWQVTGNSLRRVHSRDLVSECILLDLDYFENLKRDQSHCRTRKIARGLF